MSELEMKTEAEVEDFTDELSDEALDRAEGAYCGGWRLQAAQERPAPDDEASGAGRTCDQEFIEEPGHRARSLRRVRDDDDRGGTDGAPSEAP